MAPQHSSAFMTLVEDAKSRIQECSVEQVRERQLKGDALHLIDVREESEWQAGHAQGAQYLGKGILERDIEATIPDRDAEIVLYCGGGFRSALAADTLQKMGYTRVSSLAGGMSSWRAAGYPEQA